MRTIVDGMNVIGSRPDGWWKDRDGAVRRLVAKLQDYADARDVDVTLVLDGRPIDHVPEGDHAGVHVKYARRGGRDAADDRIVELVRDDDAPNTLLVVTSDRDLEGRVRALGASTTGARRFVEEMDEAARS